MKLCKNERNAFKRHRPVCNLCLKACLHVTSSFPSKSPSKFNIVSMVMDTLMEKRVVHPFLPARCLTQKKNGDIDGTCKQSLVGTLLIPLSSFLSFKIGQLGYRLWGFIVLAMSSGRFIPSMVTNVLHSSWNQNTSGKMQIKNCSLFRLLFSPKWMERRNF